MIYHSLSLRYRLALTLLASVLFTGCGKQSLPLYSTLQSSSLSSSVSPDLMLKHSPSPIPTASATPVSTPNSTPTPTSGISPIRVAAGGGSYTDSAGQTWSADFGFSGGTAYSKSNLIAGTSDPTLYQNQRYGDFSYSFNEPAAGSYSVKLKFSEIFWSSPGQRVFNVAINGQPVLTNFDIAAVAGSFTALDKTFPVTLTSSGTITIQFVSVINYASVSAIEILSGSAPSPIPAPSATPSISPSPISGGGSGSAISSVTLSPTTGTGVNITWITSVDADSQVEYGPTSNYGASTSLDPNFRIEHSQSLSGLSGGMLYHYRLKSRDRNGNLAVSNDMSFTAPPGGVPAGAVVLNPGNDLNSSVQAHGTGTTFYLSAGVYRLQTISPKDGDVFIGAPGAILSGAQVITGAVRSGSVWIYSGVNVPDGHIISGSCQNGSDLCHYPEDIYFDGVLKQRVSSAAAVGPGQFFINYGANPRTITVGDDPTGHMVEMNTTRYAFVGPGAGVTLAGLTIQNYASTSQDAAVWLGDRNTVKDCIIQMNHAAGLGITSNLTLLRNVFTRNGQYGMIGIASNVLVKDGEISHNNEGVYPYYDLGNSGGFKFHYTTDTTIDGVWAHHNSFAGIWFDYANDRITIKNNRTDHNYATGIDVELNFSATTGFNVHHNLSDSDGQQLPADQSELYWQAGIFCIDSNLCDIWDNTVINGVNGIGATDDSRDNSAGPAPLKNLHVHGNYFRGLSRMETGCMTTGMTSCVGAGNHWDGNIYYDANPMFEYNGAIVNYSTWQSHGFQ